MRQRSVQCMQTCVYKTVEIIITIIYTHSRKRGMCGMVSREERPTWKYVHFDFMHTRAYIVPLSVFDLHIFPIIW